MTIRLGTRGSALALAQAVYVADLLDRAEIVPIRTSGDERRPMGRSQGLAQRGSASEGASTRLDGEGAERSAPDDKSRFVREIETALLGGEVDLAIHSAKDLPAELPEGLGIVAVPPREAAQDAFVGPAGSIATIRQGARIGTSSLRRRSQLLAARPDLELVPQSGNVDTRLDGLNAGSFDGIVLAAAGLRRLGREAEIAFLFDSAQMTPAAGQGALALEARLDDASSIAAASELADPVALAELSAEREVVRELEADCTAPIGVWARATGDAMTVETFVGLPDGSEWVRDKLEGPTADPVGLGRELAERLRAAGALELLARAGQARP